MSASIRAYRNNANLLKDVVEEIQEISPVVPNDIPSFCKCGFCVLMPTSVENKFCEQRVLCRSKTQVFANVCVDRQNVETAIKNIADAFVATARFDNKALRHGSYRQYIMWQMGHLGKNKRVVIPSCCVWAIRRAYPSPDGFYRGFLPSKRTGICI